MTWIERGLAVGAAVLLVLAVVGSYSGVPRGIASHPMMAGTIDPGVPPVESTDAVARAVIETDPFRLDRRPTSVPFRADLEGIAPPPKQPEPQLVLEGLVGTAALIDGAPGHSTTAIVYAGDTLGGLRIRKVGRDTVIVTGADTTWRLALRHAWQ